MAAAGISALPRLLASEFGTIDLPFNNAGYQGEFKPISDYPADDFAKVIEINLVGAFHVLRVVSEQMVSQNSGAIVNTTSMAGVEGPPNMGGYGAFKFGVHGPGVHVGSTGRAAGGRKHPVLLIGSEEGSRGDDRRGTDATLRQHRRDPGRGGVSHERGRKLRYRGKRPDFRRDSVVGAAAIP